MLKSLSLAAVLSGVINVAQESEFKRNSCTVQDGHAIDLVWRQSENLNESIQELRSLLVRSIRVESAGWFVRLKDNAMAS